MPVVVPIIVAVAAVVSSGFTVASIVAAVVTIAASFVSQALLKPGGRSSPSSLPQAQVSAPSVDNKITVRQPAAARTIVYGRTRVSGVIAFLQTSHNNDQLHMVLLMAGHQIEAYDEIWFNDEKVTIDGSGTVTTGTFANRAFVTRYPGFPTQQADPFLIQVTGGVWNQFCRLQGIAYLIVHLIWDPVAFQGGIPNITAVVRGKTNIYDPRSGTFGYTDNSALCLADYLHDPVYGIPVAYGGTGIDTTALSAAANACDEQLATSIGVEKRFTTDGVLTSEAQLQENMGRLLGAMHGRSVYDGESWTIIAGVYQAATEAFTDDALRAGPKIQTMVSRRDLFNGVKGTFIGPSSAWQKADFPPHASASYVAADGGQEIWKDIELTLTSSPARAQRIAKIDLQKVRQPIRASMPCKLSAWRCKAGDTIMWTSPRYGWVAKLFEVSRAQLAVDRDTMTVGVDLELIETDPSVYDWLSSEEASYDPAPNTFFASPRTPLPASNLRISESLYVARTGAGVKAAVRIEWDASPDAFVLAGGHYEAAYREVGGTIWTSLGSTTELAVEWPDARPGQYDFRVLAVNYRNVKSPALIKRQQILGLSAPPAAPTGFTVGAMGNVLAMAQWDLTPELDVAQGGQIVFRFAKLTSGATWADATSIGNPQPANAAVAWLPLKSGTYLAKYMDSTGQWSDPVSFVQRQDSVLAFTLLSGGELIEDPGFAGMHNGTVADVGAGTLALAGADEFDAVPDVDALVNWDYAGGVVTSGHYDWSQTLDLGGVQRFRLTVAMASTVTDVFDDFDSRVGLVDDWPSWDGAVSGDEADAWTMVRTTQDDPGGAPTWTDWQRIDAAEFVARAAQLRTELRSTDTNYNIVIRDLSARLEGVA